MTDRQRAILEGLEQISETLANIPNVIAEARKQGEEHARAVLAPETPTYLIRKYSGFYRPNSQGYTGSAIQAGRYTLDEAIQITHPNGPDGPRDGMTFIHEDDLRDEDWTAYRALQAERDKLQTELKNVLEREAASTARWEAKIEAAEAALPRAYMRGRDNIGQCFLRKCAIGPVIRALTQPPDLGKGVADE